MFDKTHNTNTTFPGSSDSPSLRQLLLKSHDCGLQLMELINEAVLHLQENKKINANRFCSHTWPGLILSYLLPRAIMWFINLKPHLGTGPCRVCWSCSPVVCEPVSGRPSWPGDLHPARGCRPPSLPFHLRSTGRRSKPSGTLRRNRRKDCSLLLVVLLFLSATPAHCTPALRDECACEEQTPWP